MSFFIERIKIRNIDSSKSKMIKLEKGLNLIYGPSNQGKSLIYQLINYVFGGEESFFNITEIVGYESVELELCDGSKKYLLKRSLIEKNPEIQFIEQGKGIQWLAPQHNSDKTDNISYAMLKLSGLRFPAKARKNESGVTQVISFRNVVKFLMVSEDDIGNTDEVLFFSNVENTFYLNLLKYLLINEDDSYIQEVKSGPKKKVEEGSYNQTIKILKDILENNKLELKTEGNEVLKEDSLEELEAKFQLKLEKKAELSQKKEEIKKTMVKEKRTLKKFNDLFEYYREEIEKLNFNEEGNNLFKLLNTLPCEKCGESTPIYSSQKVANLGETIYQEKMKLIVHQREIEKAINDINQEVQQYDEKLKEIQVNIEKVESYIKERIHPEIERAFDIEKDVQRKQGIRDNISYFEHKIQEIEKKKTDVSESPSKKYKTEDDFIEIKNTGLESTICEILNTWGMKTDTLTVDKNNDRKGRLEIYKDGKPRAAEGQGVRGIIHSAFNVAILKIMMNQPFSRPNFLMLDSPLKNLEEKTPELNKEERDNITKKMLEDLTDNYRKSQVIIVENERPILESLKELKKRKEKPNLIELKTGLL